MVCRRKWILSHLARHYRQLTIFAMIAGIARSRGMNSFRHRSRVIAQSVLLPALIPLGRRSPSFATAASSNTNQWIHCDKGTHMDLGRTFHRHFSSKNRADSGSTLHAVESKASSNFENVTTENEINIKTIEQKEDTISTSGSIIENQTTAVKSSQIPVWRKGIHRRVGVAFSALGFVISSSRALWTDKQSAWKPTAEALRNFLQTSGIDLELSPLLNVRLLDNVILLNRIEWAALRGQDRRDLALQSSPTLLPIPSHEEALRYMKYATAAYGDVMIRAAEMDVLGKFDDRLSPATRERISEHCGIPVNDIVLMDVDYAGDNSHLRHFVAIDHINMKIVLAIRGTFSLSELVVDAAGFSRPFCNGEAHSEMATMAERIWLLVGETVLALLKQNASYEFIITGHSLGAGTATLLNVMCHENNRALVGGRAVRCFAYAPPPTFRPLEIATDAVSACSSYIHELDVVPFLSVDAVRHLFNCLKAIEDQNLSWRRRLKLTSGYEQPDETLIEAIRVANENRLETKFGAPQLLVPAAVNVWMQETYSTGDYSVKLCDSSMLANLGILLHSKMLEHHFPSRYEHAFHNLVE